MELKNLNRVFFMKSICREDSLLRFTQATFAIPRFKKYFNSVEYQKLYRRTDAEEYFQPFDVADSVAHARS